MAWEPKIRLGGMMRCCVATIDEIVSEYQAAGQVPEELTFFDCKYEEPGNKSIIYKDGTFVWSGVKDL